ncbi:hybrid sensor histidine kinase/response regulator transcription factor [Mucilaginibacter terrae]|uniref:hybrid sensor histidine kinase/response regulator transcription factor n=1 Tax=Mucilaginibacter terrae TaxID=1955052 RepID=UPI0028964EE9|nr:two-component regulator propeller domain-containing protein [Mucilaginibacter terrae]
MAGSLFSVYAQHNNTLSFSRIDRNEGLSNSSVESIAQDSRGFIWFGTTDGLNRFDGAKMAVFRHVRGNQHSLSSNFIRKIFKDRSGRLWLGTSNGLNLFEPETNTFSSHIHRSAYVESKGDRINDIYEDADQALWVATGWGSISKVNVKERRFEDYYFRNTQSAPQNNSNVYCIAHRNVTSMWVGTQNGVRIFDIKSRKFIDPPYQLSKKIPYRIRTLAVTRSGQLWIGTEENGLFRANLADGKLEHFQYSPQNSGSLGSNRIISMAIGAKDQLYVGTVNGGFNVFNEENKSFVKYINDPALPNSISQRSVSAIFLDKQQNIWLGTPRGGVDVATTSRPKFDRYQHNPNRLSISYNDVKSFSEDEHGNIWIGTDGGGLNYFNRETGAFKAYRNIPGKSNTLGSDQVMSVLSDHAGRLWAGTFDGGLNLFDPTNGTFERFVHDSRNKASIASNLVEDILEDSKKRLWVCTYNGGLNLFDPQKKEFVLAGQGKTPDKQISGVKLLSVKEDRQGKLWIVTDDAGLNRYDPETGGVKHYFNKGLNSDLTAVFIDHYGRIWAGKNGLYLYHPDEDRFILYKDAGELKNEFIKGILESTPGELWISTTNGIYQFNILKKTLKNYNTNDGLQGMEFEFNSCLKARDGTMFFGGTNGFNAFKPDSIKLNNFMAPIYFTSLEIFNQKIKPAPNSVLSKDISYTGEIVLSPEQTSFGIEFALLNFVNPANNRYAYKLENFDRKWNDIGHLHHASYTNLDPGKYIFKVKAANNDGLWNPKVATLTVIISPPFYKTWWFALLTIATVLTILYLAYDFKKKLDHKTLIEKQKEEVLQLQLQFFTNISHEFRTPLSLIVGPLEALKNENSPVRQKKLYQVIDRNAQRLMRLVNELMDFRKLQSGVLRLSIRPYHASELFGNIAAEFENIAAQKEINFEVSVQNDIDTVWVDGDFVEKIIYNLLNNAFKYTEAGGVVNFNVWTSMKEHTAAFQNQLQFLHPVRAEKYLYIRVKDSGIGISPESIVHLFERYYRISNAHLGSGIGLAFVKSLTELHRGDIYVYSERHKGTELIIGLPYRKEDHEAGSMADAGYESLVRLESTADTTDFEIDDYANEVPASGKEEHDRILLVDDNLELRTFLKDVLEKHYHIMEANNGKEGLTLAKENYPDIILSDVMMPEMDGIEFCYQVKNDLDTSHIPFVMLTAKDAIESKIQGTQSGADVYLTKPLSMALLLATVKNILDQQKKSREHYIKDYFLGTKDLVQTTKDKEFLDHFSNILDQQITNSDLDMVHLSQEMGMSQSKLYQKIKKLSGQSIVEFVRSYRLKKAVQIMVHEDISINEVIYRVGIQTASHFAKIFKKEYGKTPSQFLNEIKGRA